HARLHPVRLQQRHPRLRVSRSDELDREPPAARLSHLSLELAHACVRQRELQAPDLSKPRIFPVLGLPSAEPVDNGHDGARQAIAEKSTSRIPRNTSHARGISGNAPSRTDSQTAATSPSPETATIAWSRGRILISRKTVRRAPTVSA